MNNDAAMLGQPFQEVGKHLLSHHALALLVVSISGEIVSSEQNRRRCAFA